MVTVAWHNPGAGERKQLPAFFQELGSGADVVGLAESEKWIDMFLSVNPHMALAPHVYLKTPIFYNAQKGLLQGYGSYWLSKDTNVGSKGAGPRVLNEKWFNYIYFDKAPIGGEDPLCVGTLHAAPSIQVPLQPGAETSRRELHLQQQTRSATFMNALPGRYKVVMQDANAKWSHTNMNIWRELGFELMNPTGGTHGRRGRERQIDLILAQGYRMESGLLIPGPDEDDHDGVKVTLRRLRGE